MELLRLLTMALSLLGQPAPPPDTEVFLAPLSVRGGKVVIGPLRNISNSPGYDNQPAFTPDGESVLFTSVRGEGRPDPANSAASGSDIYRYDIATGVVTQVTHSPESEYSPTVTPDKRHISVIRVEADGTQRLWRVVIPSGKARGQPDAAELVLRDIKPVGYHAWASEALVAVFVLGPQGQPATLHLADTRTGKATVVATGIGRSLQRVPGGAISFVQRTAAADGQAPALTISELDPGTQQTRALVRAPEGATEADTAWTKDGLLLMPFQGQLFGWRKGDTAMTARVDLAPLGTRSVTRVAVSPKGDWIALVAQKP